MSTAKRTGLPRYLRRPLVAKSPVKISPRPAPVLIRTVAFVPAYLRKRPHWGALWRTSPDSKPGRWRAVL